MMPTAGFTIRSQLPDGAETSTISLDKVSYQLNMLLVNNAGVCALGQAVAHNFQRCFGYIWHYRASGASYPFE